MIVQQAGAYKNLTASGVISLVPGNLLGFYVNSTSSGTVVFREGTATGTAITGTITPAIGWHCLPCACSGLAVTLGPTIDITVFFAAG